MNFHGEVSRAVRNRLRIRFPVHSEEKMAWRVCLQSPITAYCERRSLLLQPGNQGSCRRSGYRKTGISLIGTTRSARIANVSRRPRYRVRRGCCDLDSVPSLKIDTGVGPGLRG